MTPRDPPPPFRGSHETRNGIRDDNTLERFERRLLAAPLDVVGGRHRGCGGRRAAVYAAHANDCGDAAGT
jgi:hypothetical protein